MISKDDRLLSRLQALCVRKEYCSQEMYRKALKGLEGDEEGAAEMVSLLVRDKYVDDLRYASAFARDKASLDGWGSVKIRYQLLAKGISSEIIAQALESVDADKADEKLLSILSAKYRTVKGEPDARLKMLRYGLTRGYQYEQVAEAVKSVMSAEDQAI